MITALDDQVGRVVAALEKKGLRDNTIIFFASDNGGATNALFATGARSEEDRKESGGVALGEKPPASNGRFRAGKGSLYEGGVRVPAIVNWPGKLKAAVVNEPLHMVDIMPTLLAIAGGKGSDDHPFDGKDIWATLAEGKPSPHDEILINVEAFRGAIRKGDWKLVRHGHLPGQDRALQPRRRPGREDQRRRSASRDRQRAERTAGCLRPRDEAERVDQGAAGVSRGAERDALRPRLRPRGRRPAAREAASAQPMIASVIHTKRGASAGETSFTVALRADGTCPVLPRGGSRVRARHGVSRARPGRADGSVLPFPPTPSASVAGPTLQESTMTWRKEPERLKPGAPNVLIVLIDDVGFGLPDTFGGEVHTPTLTRLRDQGISYNAFHTTSICSPTRAALLTGPEPPPGRQRHDRRAGVRLRRLHRDHPQDLRHHRRDAAPLRLQVGGASASGTTRRRTRPPRWGRSTAGPPATGSTTSTASSPAKRRSGNPGSTRTSTRSSRRTARNTT